MKTYWIYSYFPAFVFCTNFGVAANMGATTYGPFVFIRPSKTFPTITKERAEGLREHELVHAKQFYRTCGINGVLYICSKKWKLKYEIEAYREQLKYVPGDIDKLAVLISTRYGINITKEEATALLKAGSGI